MNFHGVQPKEYPMKKSLTLAIIASLALAPAAFAETKAEAKADVKASEGAVAKDDAAIAKQDANIEVNRAEKADAKAKGDVAVQAKESVEIGANKTVKAAKKAEKKVDEKILEHDKKELEEKK